jgi:nitroreductase
MSCRREVTHWTAEGEPMVVLSASWGTICPAAWSFMLTERARGLGNASTRLHQLFEEEAPQLLGIPHAEVTRACLVPVTDFKAAWREPLESVVHWDAW